MAIDDDTESCSSRAIEYSTPSSKKHHRQKLEVFNDVLCRLLDSNFEDAKLPGFDDQLWLHFNRLPTRYALDVNVERAEDALTHMRLLRQAQDPSTSLAYDVHVVQVNLNTNGHAGDSVHSYSSMDEDSEGSVKNSVDLGLSLGLHQPPTFGSLQNLGALGLLADVEDRDSCVNTNNSNSLRAMHEITFSTVDKPKLLTQLTSLLSELSLNIQEAHAFSTVDGFSLDVFVVDGWSHEETEQLRRLLDEEIRKMELPQKGLLSAAVVDYQQKSSKCLHKNVVESQCRNSEVDIDQSLLKVGGKVASGSYGDLYRGTYCGQEVAIKVLNPKSANADVLKEFFQEVDIMRKVRHKNVVQFIGACTKPPNLCIVTEFMAKGNMYDFMHNRKGVFKMQSLLRAAMDISMGMEYLHQNNIIHRDLKTANLLMDDDGVVKVADFGVARVQTPGVMTSETGTYRWMAPEVIGHKPYDHKADVFSFGIVLWELLTGELPYSYLTPLQAAIGVVQKGLRPMIPEHTHPKHAALMESCWQQDPNLRPNFSEIIETLQQITNEIAEDKDEDGDLRNKSQDGGFFLFKCGHQ